MLRPLVNAINRIPLNEKALGGDLLFQARGRDRMRCPTCATASSTGWRRQNIRWPMSTWSRSGTIVLEIVAKLVATAVDPKELNAVATELQQLPACATPPGKSAPRIERGVLGDAVPGLPRRELRSANFVDPARTMGVIDMPRQERGLKRDLVVACSLFAAGVVVSGLSLAQIRAQNRMQMAQATQPLQGTPSQDDQNTPAQVKARWRPSDHAGA